MCLFPKILKSMENTEQWNIILKFFLGTYLVLAMSVLIFLKVKNILQIDNILFIFTNKKLKTPADLAAGWGVYVFNIAGEYKKSIGRVCISLN